MLAETIGPWSVEDLNHFAKGAGAVSIAIVAVASAIQSVRNRTPEPASISSDPFETAALLGGAERVVQSAIVSLARSGALILGGPDGTQLAISGPFPGTGAAVERAIYDHLGTQSSARVIDLLQGSLGLRAVQDVVWGRPEVPSELRVRSLWLIPLRLSIPLNLCLLGFAVYRHFSMSEAIPSWKTFAFNILLLIVHWRFSHPRNPRRELLTRLQEIYPAKGAALESKSPAEWARAVAIHGPYALSGTALSDYVVQFGYVA